MDDAVVAGHLALAAKAALNPGQAGVQGEENQADFLQQIRPVVTAAQVLGFMQHDLVELPGSEAGEEPVWNENARGKEADDTGTFKLGGGADLDGAAAEDGAAAI